MADIEQTRQALRRKVLGYSIACDPIFPGVDIGRDIRFERGPNGLDLARVEGLDNLGQALGITFTTLLGSDLFNAQFGFDGINAIAEETIPLLARERMRIAAISALRKDRRIRRILDVKLDGGQLDPPQPGSRLVEIRVEFETFSEDQASLDLGKVLLNA